MIFRLIYGIIAAEPDVGAAIIILSAYLRFGNVVAGAIHAASGD
jgi:hypothetical protein